MNNDLYTPGKKAMPEVPGARFVQHNYHDIDLLDGSFVDKIYISVVEQIDDAIVAECVKIAHEAGLGQGIVLNKKFITDAIREKLERANNDAPAVDAEVVRHGRWIMRGGYIRCSECDAKTLWKDAGGTGGFSHEYEQVRSVHCHNCGAKMIAEVEG